MHICRPCTPAGHAPACASCHHHHPPIITILTLSYFLMYSPTMRSSRTHLLRCEGSASRRAPIVRAAAAAAGQPALRSLLPAAAVGAIVAAAQTETLHRATAKPPLRSIPLVEGAEAAAAALVIAAAARGDGSGVTPRLGATCGVIRG
eukprot:122371-Chlamydomonas_euryale.AAC.1